MTFRIIRLNNYPRTPEASLFLPPSPPEMSLSRHEGPFPVPGGKPIPPTGKKIRVSQCMIAKLDEGKIIEIYEYFNPLDFMSQLGMTM